MDIGVDERLFVWSKSSHKGSIVPKIGPVPAMVFNLEFLRNNCSFTVDYCCFFCKHCIHWSVVYQQSVTWASFHGV